MKNYILLKNNIVQEIIPEVDPHFPSFAVEDRYPAEFLATLLEADENIEVQTGWIFDAETQLFSPPKVENPTLAVEILKDKLVSSDYKITKQAEAEFAGAELPYTEDEMKELHAERQDLRDQINMLESGSET